MKMTKYDLIKMAAEEFVGKTVFFLDSDRKPIKGKITNFDNHQFYVGKKHGLSYDDSEFFFSIEDMLDWIKKT